MSFGTEWIELNISREILEDIIWHYCDILEHYKDDKSFKKKFLGNRFVLRCNSVIDVKLDDVKTVNDLFNNDNKSPIEIQNVMANSSKNWQIMKEGAILYEKDLEESMKHLKEKFNLSLKDEEKYLSTYKTILDVLKTNIPDN